MTDTASISSDRQASSSSSYVSSPPVTSPAGRRVSSISHHRPPPLDLSTSHIDRTLPGRPRSQPAMVVRGRGESGAVVATKSLLPPTPASSSYTHQDNDEEYGAARDKKRARSIDVDEANHPSIARLGLYTPTTARSDGPRELICLCAKAPKVPRPRNAFILYRQAWQGHFVAQHPGLANPEISKLIGVKWREQPESVKNEWKQLAEEEKIRHQRQYPGYRYQPRRGGKSGSGRPTSSNGENPGRCPKCGGRYIVTPRTPTTPFSVASPPPPSKHPPNMQFNSDHPRHGSISGGAMPMDGYGRRYTQPQFRDMEEDYPLMSPMVAPHSGIPPDVKRRRYNGPPVYIPGSPHMGYGPVDPRYQQRPSVSGPPISATSFGPENLARHPPQHRAPIYPHMQPPPPPRQSMAYQPAPTPRRHDGGFDESLRLPPLQTQMQEPPATSTDTGTRHQVMPPAQAQANPGTGLGIMNPGASAGPGPIRKPQAPAPALPMPQKWPFLLKLEVLRSIIPPLRPPGPGGPHFETRGPIIAVEGAPTPILKEVAAVIERALSVSAEFAVKVWSEDTSTAIAHSSPEPHANLDGTVQENGNTKNSNNGIGNGDAVQQQQQRKPSLISPIASYVARILKWHKTSEDLVRYITSYPPQAHNSSSSDNISNGTVTDSANGTPNPSNHNPTSPPPRLPVAVLSDGYSLTFSDRYANALHVNDAYRADDHWQWVATLWRGIVGADLTVYVKRATSPDEMQGNNCVEMAGPGVMVLRVLDRDGGGGRVDEKLERRLGFEIAEWVRGGSFMVGFGK